MFKKYSHNFYKDKHQETLYSASTILALVVDMLPGAGSVVDFGCGVGSWLVAMQELGATEVQGFDGPWIRQELLQIPVENFSRVDLDKEIQLDHSYDLAISLEVAEHLHADSASVFVQSLVNSSDFVLFSAAVPLQGGTNHINEQWPDYWAKIFNEQGYKTLDVIRSQIWENASIPFWYKQNVLLFVKEERVKDLKLSEQQINFLQMPLRIVHPDMYLTKIRKMSSIKGSLKSFRRAIRKIFTGR